MLDVLKYNKEIAENKATVLEKLGLTSKKYIVATVHRQSNTDSFKNLSSIIKAFCDVKLLIVFPLHPRTEKYLKYYGLRKKLCDNIKLIPPVGYLEMLKLMTHARKILTDSGGIQKEAYLLGVPCITMRENTEWIETVEEGWNILVGADYDKIKSAILSFEGAKLKGNVFGAGQACVNICEILKKVPLQKFQKNIET